MGKTEINLKSIDRIILGGTGKRILDKIRGVVKLMQEDFRKDGKKDELIFITEIIKYLRHSQRAADLVVEEDGDEEIEEEDIQEG